MKPSNLHFDSYSTDKPDSDPVVLLHGLGSCSEDWGLQVPALARRHTIFALDLPGHGASPPLQGWPQIADYAAAVAGWMADEELRSAHIVGLSLGGLVALQMGINHARLVKSLTVVNAFSRMHFEPRNSLHSLGRLLLLLAGRMEWLGVWVASALFPDDGQEALRSMAAKRIAANPRRSYLQAVLAIARFNLDRHVHALDCPVMIVAGARDRIVPLRAKQALAANIPAARFEVIPSSGHVTPIDSSERFNQLLVEFL